MLLFYKAPSQKEKKKKKKTYLGLYQFFLFSPLYIIDVMRETQGHLWHGPHFAHVHEWEEFQK